MLKKSIAAAAAATLLAGAASAQVGVDLGLGADVELGVGAEIRVGSPYEYQGYRSGRWYPYERPRRDEIWFEEYGGYDCYRAFRYDWDDRRRTRHESWWCYDDRGRDYEVRRTRVSVRID